jgi:hypothetical protein
MFHPVSYVMSANHTKEEARCDIMPHKSKPFNKDVKTKKQNFSEPLFLLLLSPEL